MSLDFTFGELSEEAVRSEAGSLSGLHEQMVKIIQPGGALPTSPAIPTDLTRMRAREGAGAEKFLEIIEKDPVLCIRLITLCAGSYYSRGQTIMDVDSAVNHLGLLRLGDLIAEHSSVEKLDKFFLGRSLGLVAYEQALFTGIVASRLWKVLGKSSDGRYRRQASILGFITNLWPALFATTRSDLYSGCLIETAIEDRNSLDKTLRKVFKKGVPELSADLLDSLGVPADFTKLSTMFGIPPWNRRNWAVAGTDQVRGLSGAAYLSNRISNEICAFAGKQPLLTLMKDVSVKCEIEHEELIFSLAGVRQTFVEHCNLLGLPALRLPDYLGDFDDELVDDDPVTPAPVNWPQVSQRINPFLLELKAGFRAAAVEIEPNRLRQMVACTLLALIRGLNFDRAVFFRYDESGRQLIPILVFGREIGKRESNIRYVSEAGQEYMPDVQAVLQKRTSFRGDPLFSEDWPFVAFPAVQGDRSLGVFYADRKGVADAMPLGTDEEVAAMALSEIWHNIPTDFA